MAHHSGLNTRPEVIAELGPGDSLGIGLTALLTGSNKYYAFDAVSHAEITRNLKVFDELVRLLKNRTPIPNNIEFPNVKPEVMQHDFPSDILDENRLEISLDEARLKKIRDSICKINQPESMIKYKAPWSNSNVIEDESVDLIYSQAVLEHVDELENTYTAMGRWLKRGGYLSHQIDFKCHRTSTVWNGHWTFSKFLWRLIRGNRPYSLNREPFSRHVNLLKQNKFKIVKKLKNCSESKISRAELAAEFKEISEDDLTTSGVFIQAVK